MIVRMYFVQLLDLATGYARKNEICGRIRKFLCEQTTEAADVRSHRLLEILLYQVALNAHSGKQKTALRIMQVGERM